MLLHVAVVYLCSLLHTIPLSAWTVMYLSLLLSWAFGTFQLFTVRERMSLKFLCNQTGVGILPPASNQEWNYWLTGFRDTQICRRMTTCFPKGLWWSFLSQEIPTDPIPRTQRCQPFLFCHLNVCWMNTCFNSEETTYGFPTTRLMWWLNPWPFNKLDVP